MSTCPPFAFVGSNPANCHRKWLWTSPGVVSTRPWGRRGAPILALSLALKAVKLCKCRIFWPFSVLLMSPFIWLWAYWVEGTHSDMLIANRRIAWGSYRYVYLQLEELVNLPPRAGPFPKGNQCFMELRRGGIRTSVTRGLRKKGMVLPIRDCGHSQPVCLYGG